MFAFGNVNVHHKDWLTCSGQTNRPGELYYNFSISNYLTQMVNFPTCIPDCDSICSTMAFSLLGNSDNVVVSVSLDFPSISKWDASFHYIAYDYSRAAWDGVCDRLGNVPLEDIFKCYNCCEWVLVGIDVCIPHTKYQVKPH